MSFEYDHEQEVSDLRSEIARGEERLLLCQQEIKRLRSVVRDLERELEAAREGMWLYREYSDDAPAQTEILIQFPDRDSAVRYLKSRVEKVLGRDAVPNPGDIITDDLVDAGVGGHRCYWAVVRPQVYWKS